MESKSPFQASDARIAERGDEALPARFRAGAAGIEHETRRDIELANRILGSLEITAHPIKAVGDTAEHRSQSPQFREESITCRTHVSLLPPPCEELTTSEPFSKRHSGKASGHDIDLVAEENVGPQVNVPRFELVPDEAGRTRKASVGWAM